MADEADSADSRVFWCNTNRRGGVMLEQRMRSRCFAAAWTAADHPDGTFNYHDHMRRVRRGDLIFMYAKDRGVIGVGHIE